MKVDYAKPIKTRCRRFPFPKWKWCGKKQKFPRRFNPVMPIEWQGER